MSRNGSGVFSLAAGNPVSTGSTISSTWANNTLSDIATQITNSVAADGQTTMSGALKMGNQKVTGMANGTTTGDALSWTQLFSQGAPATLASAGTVDIGASTTVAVEITGTTTITSFGTNYNGPRFLRFTGALTLTHNSTTLNLPGAANITTVAGDTCIVYPNSSSNGWNVVSYQLATYAPAGPVVLRSYLSGCTLSTAGSSATMSIAAGQCTDSTNAVTMSLAATSKTTAAWTVPGAGNGGLDTGTIANNTWYYFYVIRRPDTGVVDVVFSTSSTSPTLPANYTQYRYIGAGLINGLTQWTKFTQFGDEFTWDTPVLDYNTTGSTTAANLTLSIPRGRKMKAWMNVYLNQDTNQVYFSDPSNSDLAPSLTAAPLGTLGYTSASFAGTVQATCWTNTSAQVRHREANGTGTLRVATLGWTDLRGKDL